jgi:hypothetical protein
MVVELVSDGVKALCKCVCVHMCRIQLSSISRVHSPCTEWGLPMCV